MYVAPLYTFSLSHAHTQAKSVAYEQELYNQFTYRNDRPFFHTFPGDVSACAGHIRALDPASEGTY